MSGKPSKVLLAFMEAHGICADEVWEVRAGGAWAIKHSALERVAAERGIKFERPSVVEVNTAEKIMVVCVFGTMGEHTEWSFGEASPANCKNAYPASMAEKRAKDRVALKLLNAHGALYSEDEADDFAQPPKRENPHVTRPDDIFPNTDGDQNNIPAPHSSIAPKPKAKSRDEFSTLQAELWRCGSHDEMKTWGAHNANRIGEQPADWQKILRGIYKEHWDGIALLNDGDNTRMAS